MYPSDLLSEIYNGLTSNKVRSGLTILGIVIGIASVIVMIAVGQGSQKTVRENIQSTGSNLLTIRPGFQRSFGTQVRSASGSAQSLSLEDSDAIYEAVEFVDAIAPQVSGNYQVTATNGNNTNTSIVGTVPEYPSVVNQEVEYGSFITQKQVDNLGKVAVLGSETAETLFTDSANALNQIIRINGVNFTVIGVNKEKGGSGFGSSDDSIVIPITTASQYLTGDDALSSLSIKVLSEEYMTLAENQIEQLLLSRHNIEDPDEADFRIMNQEDILEMATSITGTLTVLLGVVAGISLIVGGIGIMNMMLTTVTERTREIGLRKAIGATRGNINLQFFAEAVALTSIGGFIGVSLGWAIAFIMEHSFNIETEVSLSSVLLAFGVSALIGIIFGYYPAQKASKLDPIVALRYQ